MKNIELDHVLRFLNIDKNDILYNEKFIKMRRAEQTLAEIVQNETKDANDYLGRINHYSSEIIYKKPVNLKLNYYRDPGRVLNSFIAMEYTICGNTGATDVNTKQALYRIVIPEIIKKYNKTKISNTVKIKEGSMFECTLILYQD